MACVHSSAPGHTHLTAWERMGSEDRRRGRRWGGEVERKAGCGGGGCLLWALISLLRVWQGTEDDSTGDIFYFSRPRPGKSAFQACICVANRGSEKPANKQYSNLQHWHCGVSLFPQLLPSQRGNDRLCHGYRAWLWLVRRLSTISIRNPTAAGLITVS